MYKKILIITAGIFLVLFILLIVLTQKKASKRPAEKVYTTPVPSSSFSPQDGDSKPPLELQKESMDYYKQKRPDAYLAQFVQFDKPYEAVNFSIKREFVTATGTFQFIVTLKGDDTIQSRRDAVTWIRSQGLSDEQILQLSLTFINE